MKIKRRFILFYLLAYTIISCSKSATTTPVPLPVMGQIYQGGIVFYIDGSGKHGLAAAPGELSTSAQWGCQGTLTSATGTANGTGAQNTSAILNNCATAGIAARLCNSYTAGGYGGYYLPSKDELNLMYTTIKSAGGFATNYYWSSTEGSTNEAWFQYFGNGFQDTANKSTQFFVRPARAF